MSSKPCLLAVDDKEMNLNVIEDLLGDEFNIHPVKNGQSIYSGATKPE